MVAHLHKQISSIDELKFYIHDWYEDYFILIGGCRSSKNIQIEDNKFLIINEIDDTEQTLSEEDLFNIDLTLIGKAMNEGCLFQYNYT